MAYLSRDSQDAVPIFAKSRKSSQQAAVRTIIHSVLFIRFIQKDAHARCKMMTLAQGSQALGNHCIKRLPMLH
jgi:hypothetical protein